MKIIGSIATIIVSAAFLAGVTLNLQAAGQAAPAGEAQAETPSAPPKKLECHSEALTGSGPGFKSSQEESEEAAKANWLEKAKAIYPDADWASAKEPLMQCVKQGLYSKCFATGFPCRPKPE